MTRRPITPETHPRLLARMRWQGILSDGEAVSALEAVRDRRNTACEAVDHYGGPFQLFLDTVKRRHTIGRMVRREERK